MHTWSCSKYLTLAHIPPLYSTRLNYLAGINQVNIATIYSMSYPCVIVYLFMHVSKLSEFIQSDVPSNTITDTKWIRNSSWIGRSKISNIRRTRKKILANTREAGARNKQQVITSTESDSHRILFACLFPFLYRCNPLYRNLNSTTILVHRTTVHMWRWFNGLVFLILMKTN